MSAPVFLALAVALAVIVTVVLVSMTGPRSPRVDEDAFVRDGFDRLEHEARSRAARRRRELDAAARVGSRDL
jgi:hypothetical protein